MATQPYIIQVRPDFLYFNLLPFEKRMVIFMSRRQPILPMHLMKARNFCYLDSLLDISDIPLLVIFDLQISW